MKKYIVILYVLFPFALNAQIITTVVGNGISGISGNGGPATAAHISSGQGGTFDKYGNFYYSEVENEVRIVDTAGIINAYAGNESLGFSGDGGLATAAAFRFLQGITCDTAGNLYIADHQNFRIREVNAVTGIINTIAGDGSATDAGDGGPATNAGFFPSDIIFDRRGNFYISENSNQRIRKINTAGIITTYAGTGVTGFSGDGSAATSAQLYGPEYMAIDSKENLYIADVKNKRVRKVDTFGIITTVAGTGASLYNGDGIPATTANMVPYSIAIDPNDNLYISDTAGRIRMVDTLGIIHTAVGTGVPGYNGDGIPDTAAQINSDGWIVFDACGNMYFDDVYNYRIRKVTLPPIYTTPTITLSGATTAAPGAMVTVNATVGSAGSSYEIYWYNDGVLFATTTVPMATYTQTAGTDTITALIVPTGYGCYDSAMAAPHVVTAVSTGIQRAAWGMGVHVYPNPASNVITISANNNINNITITNLVGQAMLTEPINARQAQADVAGFPAGVYIIKVTGEGGETMIAKFVKE